jgi:hypothetical protein
MTSQWAVWPWQTADAVFGSMKGDEIEAKQCRCEVELKIVVEVEPWWGEWMVRGESEVRLVREKCVIMTKVEVERKVTFPRSFLPPRRHLSKQRISTSYLVSAAAAATTFGQPQPTWRRPATISTGTAGVW